MVCGDLWGGTGEAARTAVHVNQLTRPGVPLLPVMEIAFVPLFNSLRRYILLNFVCNLACRDGQKLKHKNIKIVVLLGIIILMDVKWDSAGHTTLEARGRGFCVLLTLRFIHTSPECLYNVSQGNKICLAVHTHAHS